MNETVSYQPTVAPTRTLSEIPRPRRDGYPGAVTTPSAQENRMTVGREIRLKGEISNCDVLIVEGDVEATVESKMLEIAEGGRFNGTATVDSADIHGNFDGTLTVSGLLRIHGTGKLSGKVRYGRIEVEAGGELSGDVASGDAGKPAAEIVTVDAS